MVATEQHYSPQQVADKWGVSAKTVQRMMRDEPGVLVIALPQIRKARKRKETLRIPESVVARVYERRTVRPLASGRRG